MSTRKTLALIATRAVPCGHPVDHCAEDSPYDDAPRTQLDRTRRRRLLTRQSARWPSVPRQPPSAP